MRWYVSIGIVLVVLVVIYAGLHLLRRRSA